MQNLKPSQLDVQAELEALLEASDIYARRRIFLYVTETKKNNACGIRARLKNAVFMRIGMTAAQNDERGDQGLARTVDKIS